MITVRLAKALACSAGWMVTLAWLLIACTPSTPAGPAVLPQVTGSPAAPASPQAVTPTPVIPAEVSLQTFVHDSNRFRIQYPETWQSFESEEGVIFVEPGDHAGLSVFFDDVQETYSTDDLNLYLTNYILRNFLNKETNFKPISQDIRSDQVVIAQFSTINEAGNEIINELRVLQQDTIVYLVLMNATTEQWPISGDRLRELANTFTPENTASYTKGSAADPAAPIWVLVGPDSKAFAFFRASDWEIRRLEEDLVSVEHEETGMAFTASQFSWPNAAIDPKAPEKAALEAVQTLAEANPDLEHLPPQPFPLAGEPGTTIDFLYTATDGTKTAGSVVTAVHKGQMLKIVFAAPADIYEAALEWFNPMLRSFTFLSPEEIPLEELQPE